MSEFNKTYTLQLEDKSNADGLNFLRSKLVNFNRSRVGDENFQSLLILLRDDGNNSVGGLYGESYRQWLYIDLLWVEENVHLQGQGTRFISCGRTRSYQTRVQARLPRYI